MSRRNCDLNPNTRTRAKLFETSAVLKVIALMQTFEGIEAIYYTLEL